MAEKFKTPIDIIKAASDHFKIARAYPDNEAKRNVYLSLADCYEIMGDDLRGQKNPICFIYYKKCLTALQQAARIHLDPDDLEKSIALCEHIITLQKITHDFEGLMISIPKLWHLCATVGVHTRDGFNTLLWAYEMTNNLEQAVNAIQKTLNMPKINDFSKLMYAIKQAQLFTDQIKQLQDARLTSKLVDTYTQITLNLMSARVTIEQAIQLYCRAPGLNEEYQRTLVDIYKTLVIKTQKELKDTMNALSESKEKETEERLPGISQPKKAPPKKRDAQAQTFFPPLSNSL